VLAPRSAPPPEPIPDDWDVDEDEVVEEAEVNAEKNQRVWEEAYVLYVMQNFCLSKMLLSMAETQSHPVPCPLLSFLPPLRWHLCLQEHSNPKCRF
jgi:hypothetical protein